MDKGTNQGINVVLLIVFTAIFGAVGWLALRGEPAQWMRWFVIGWAVFNFLNTIFKITRDMVNGD